MEYALTFSIIIHHRKDESSESEDEYDQKEDLYVRFQRLLGPETCVPEHAQRVL